VFVYLSLMLYLGNLQRLGKPHMIRAPSHEFQIRYNRELCNLRLETCGRLPFRIHGSMDDSVAARKEQADIKNDCIQVGRHQSELFDSCFKRG
jgi:hypothetical protein